MCAMFSFFKQLRRFTMFVIPFALQLPVVQAWASLSGQTHHHFLQPMEEPSLQPPDNISGFVREVRSNMRSALGCGETIERKQLMEIRSLLFPMWKILPKNKFGRIGRQTLRRLTYRYFMRRSGFQLRGFEPWRAVNESHWGAVDILSQQLPGYVEMTLESQHAAAHGFGLSDAMLTIGTLEKLIFESESTLLKHIYIDHNKSTAKPIPRNELKDMLHSYLVHWLFGDDGTQEAVHQMDNKTYLQSHMPHYADIVEFFEGHICTFDFSRQHQVRARYAGDALASLYTFDDFHKIVGAATWSFSSFLTTDCMKMKQALVELDTWKTGRVLLSKFYAAGLRTEFQFVESKAYLRKLGALDESSAYFSRQVIISNYMQATSNCMVSTPYYKVCCPNECEAILSDIEFALDNSSSTPSAILSVVRSMSVQTALLDDSPPTLGQELQAALEQIAAQTDGQILLYGRLFAQWLHYVFPSECPFPHKNLAAVGVEPHQFGNNSKLSPNELVRHSFDPVDSFAERQLATIGREDLQWMSLWSHDEEPFLDAVEIEAPWQRPARPITCHKLLAPSCLVMLVCAVLCTHNIGLKVSGKISKTYVSFV